MIALLFGAVLMVACPVFAVVLLVALGWKEWKTICAEVDEQVALAKEKEAYWAAQRTEQ